VNVTLSNKSAIVTGAASGIGLAVVLKYLEAEAAGVVAVDVAEIPETLRQLEGAGRLKYVRGDVGAEATAEAFTRAALDAFGRIDVLVNNAGVSVVKPLHAHTPEEWERVMNVNVRAVYFAARHVVPVMMRQRSGVILNTGSISGQAGIPMQGAYAASKGALHQMTRQMAIDCAPHGIRVNAIACGTVDTPIVHQSAAASGDPDAFWRMLKDNHPIGRIASPDEIAAFFTYMASDWASFFTGSILMLDGGFTAR
jgi:NAD(P)-dependent dehydrogenase (short-subunit alcohol dehydrogenase family)